MPPFLQLTTTGAVVPYGICVDSEDRVWVAAKGGVFRFARNGQCLFAEKMTRKVTDGCFLALYDLGGVRRATSILETPVKSMAVAETGEIFLTLHPDTGRSEILRGRVDDLATFETVASSTEFQFDQVCCIPARQMLIVSCAQLPTNPYSEQHMGIMDFDGRAVSSFSKAGKEDGDLHWPRAIEINENGNAIILDKTGRLQEFNASGQFIRVIDIIPPGLGNGFCIDKSRNQLLVTCSGLVLSDGDHGRAICNDWIEIIPLPSPQIVH